MTHPYGRRPGEFFDLSPEEQQKLAKKITAHMVDGERPETACWIEEVPPEDFKAACQADPHLMSFFCAQRARGEAKLRKTLQAGGKGMSEAKAALEILERTYKGWERKSAVTVSDALKTILDQLMLQFEPNKTFTGAEAMDLVLGQLEAGD